ncbi:HNH endonuclease [Streptomyces sasae]|uniref:HNH endonuclease n=1 Tax=Streptomyces sasae TaxID=1266772 RepID=UPI002930743E|nr:HNH endonuclease signature motif containing protein [Streptomyces sasae]
MYERLMVLYANGGRCVYCDSTSETADHVIPWSRNGWDGTENLVPACEACNRSKSDRTPAEFVMARSHPRSWPSPGTPLGLVSLVSVYEEADKECRRVLARIGDVLSEIADKKRQRWFVDHFIRYGTLRSKGPSAMNLIRAFGSAQVEQACQAGWPNHLEQKPRHRVLRDQPGQLIEPILEDE